MNLLWHIKKIIQKHKYRKMKCGKNVRINLPVSINKPEKMTVGDNTYINRGDFAIGNNSSISIGCNCLISYHVHFRTFSHNYMNKNELIMNQGEFEKDINVEDDVWIGYGVQVLPGITIHKGAVIGAGAVVTHDIPEYAVAVGVPARVIKFRS